MDQQPPSAGYHGGHGVILNSQKRIQHKQKFFDIIYSDYGNKIFVMLFDAKFQKMGTLLHIRRESTELDKTDTFSVHTLLGVDEAEYLVFGRAIGEHILSSDTTGKSVIVSCGFKDPDLDIIQLILQTIDTMKFNNEKMI